MATSPNPAAASACCDVAAAMTVASVRVDAIAGFERVVRRLLHRESQAVPRARNAPCAAAITGSSAPKYTSVSAEMIRSKASALAAQVFGEFGLDQFVIDAAVAGATSMPAGQVDAGQPGTHRARSTDRTVRCRSRRRAPRACFAGAPQNRARRPPRAAARGSRARPAWRRSCRRTRRRWTRTYASDARAGTSVSGARRMQVLRHRVVRFLRSSHLRNTSAASSICADGVVGDAQQLARFGMVGHQGDRLAVVGDGLPDPALARQQVAHVVVGVGMFGIGFDRLLVGGRRPPRTGPARAAPRPDCCRRWHGRAAGRSPCGRPRSPPPAVRAPPGRCPGCCSGRRMPGSSSIERWMRSIASPLRSR